MHQTTFSASSASDRPAAPQPPPRPTGSAQAVQARWDPPHPVDPGSSDTGPEPAARDPNSPVASNHELLELQAAELADHLRGWEADLTRRERGLQQQIDLLEIERRQFRLWMHETQCELHAQRQALERLRAAADLDPFEFPS